MRGLLLPLARGALVQAAVLTFVLALNNFAVPAILQVKVFPAEVWVRFNTTFDSLAALLVSWPMVVTPLLLLIWFRTAKSRGRERKDRCRQNSFANNWARAGSGVCGVGTVLISSLAVGLPLVQLLSTGRTWSEFPAALAAGQMACWNSLYFALAAATLCVLLGLIGWRWPVGLALWLPFLVPGVLLGIALDRGV